MCYREKEREEKAARRAEQLAALRNSQRKQPGFQRLRAAQYDELRRQLVSKEGSNLRHSTTISADVLTSFRQTGRERGLVRAHATCPCSQLCHQLGETALTGMRCCVMLC